MNNIENQAGLLNKILDQLIQLFDLSSKIDAKNNILVRNQVTIKQQISQVIEDYHNLIEKIRILEENFKHLSKAHPAIMEKVDSLKKDTRKLDEELQSLKLVTNTLKFIQDTETSVKEKIINYGFKILLVIITGIVSFIIYYLSGK